MSARLLCCIRRRRKRMRPVSASLPKKIGHAVDRNLYKRQVRMMCQDLVDFSSCPMDGVIILRFGYKDLDYAANKNSLEKLLYKAKMLSI